MTQWMPRAAYKPTDADWDTYVGKGGVKAPNEQTQFSTGKGYVKGEASVPKGGGGGGGLVAGSPGADWAQAIQVAQQAALQAAGYGKGGPTTGIGDGALTRMIAAKQPDVVVHAQALTQHIAEQKANLTRQSVSGSASAMPRQCAPEEVDMRSAHASALKVRKVIQKLKTATKENIEGIRAEIEAAILQNLNAMGSLSTKVQQEAEKALFTQWEAVFGAEKNTEFVRMEVVDLAIKDAEDHVAIAVEAGNSLDVSDLPTVKAALVATQDAVMVSQKAIADSASELDILTQEIKAADQEENQADKVKELRKRLNMLRGSLAKLIEKQKAATHRCENPGGAPASSKGYAKGYPMQKGQPQDIALAKYDEDLDGKLNVMEVAAYSTGELSFTPSDQELEGIMLKLADDTGCIPGDQVPVLRGLLTLARRNARQEAYGKGGGKTGKAPY